MKSVSNNGFRFIHRRYLLIPLIAAAVMALFG